MPKLQIVGFDWDDGNLAKCQAHGVSISEIESVFEGPHALSPDIAHSFQEQRFLAIGTGKGLRLIFIAFTLRMGEVGQLIRPISARYMHRKEQSRYGQADPQSDH